MERRLRIQPPRAFRAIVREGYRDSFREVGFHRGWDRPGVRMIERRGYSFGHRRGLDD